MGWQHADLTGHDDQFSINLQTSPTEPSMVRVASAGYRWPLPGLRAAIDLFAAYSNVDGGTQTIAAGDLSFAGAGLNCYMLHSTCAMVRSLRDRPADQALLYGQGGYVTKHHAPARARLVRRNGVQVHSKDLALPVQTPGRVERCACDEGLPPHVRPRATAG